MLTTKRNDISECFYEYYYYYTVLMPPGMSTSISHVRSAQIEKYNVSIFGSECGTALEVGPQILPMWYMWRDCSGSA